VNGGLISILQHNSPAPIWLRRDPHGNITYTFIEGYSTTGGKPAPIYALVGEDIFQGKRDDVAEFLKSFGLSPQAANNVISDVGVSH
jgi:hypothetical protein